MSDKKLLEELGKMMISNNITLLAAVDEKIRASEKRMEKHMEKRLMELKVELKKTIKASQEDTIDVLTALINTGYSLHEKRILRLEHKVGLPPLRNKH